MISEHASPLAAIGGVDAGGQNIHVARLAAALAGRGHAVDVYTRRDSRRVPERVTVADGYTVYHVPAGPAKAMAKDELLPHMESFGRWLADRWCAVGTPNVLHAHFWMSGLAALAATRRHPIPVVMTYHALGSVKRRMQGAADTSPPDRIDLERMVGRAAHRIVAQCSDEVRELGGYGIPRERISVVPSGVDTHTFRPLSNSRRSALKRILTVGRMVERKGFADLVRAVPDLPDVRLVVAGGPAREKLADDPVASGLMRLAKELGVAGRVRLLGSVSPAQMPHWYCATELLACTPAYEPFGITPLEAMACGKPVVAYKVGGLQDTVVHGQTGALVPPGDHTALVASLRALLDDDEARAAQGRAARARVEAHYPWPTIAARVEQVYADAIRTAPTLALA